MKIVKFSKRLDFGTEWIVQLFKFKGRSIIQASFSISDYPSWPFLHVTMGNNALFSGLFLIYRYGVDIDILCYNWNMNYMEDIDGL